MPIHDRLRGDRVGSSGVDAERPHVVIVGGGFGGLTCARRLAKAPVRVTLLDRHNHHLFQPLLYQVATATLSPGDIAVPLRSILRRQKNATVLLAQVLRIDLVGRKVELADGAIAFDALVLAAGATHSWFGHADWAPHAPGLKTLEDALSIRARILRAYEEAEREEGLERRCAWLTFAIVGAGPTGVELAGALAEIARETLARDFRRIDPTQARVVLVEAGSHVLPSFPPELSGRARTQLERIGVEVRLAARVIGVDEQGLALRTEGGDPHARVERLATRTVLWAAGVAASPLGRSLDVPLDRAGRVLVEPTLAVPGARGVFVIGDLAAITSNGAPVPSVAPAAMQMGRHVAANLIRSFGGESLLPFRYRDKGSLATIGRAAAVAAYGRLRCAGPFAWLLWTVVHISYLISFRSRVLVLLQWAWLWLTKGRGVRLITSDPSSSRAAATSRSTPAEGTRSR
ncbi:MAG: NAD(P)/FAD-dependent oxidoreductase [Planctomycetes bacterium]|nr:NAD(P)/FAD-dependent oxidoreductase [Planctomycetota bacterium]